MLESETLQHLQANVTVAAGKIMHPGVVYRAFT